MAKVIKGKFKRPPEDDDVWAIQCPECDGTNFEICSNVNPEEDEDWGLDYITCAKCGAVLYDSDDYE